MCILGNIFKGTGVENFNEHIKRGEIKTCIFHVIMKVLLCVWYILLRDVY